MAETDAQGGTPSPQPNRDTLTAADIELPRHVDEQLLRRDLKARMFGSDVDVRIGRYDVLNRVGRGGMGTVYLARDPELSRRVALKLLRADRAEQRPRMLTEARALAQLSHPNVVTVHEVGTHDDRVYLAMEFVEGKTLRAWLEERPPRRALFDVFAQAARGLHAAHAAGLVHRDFKADNVLIGDDGRVRVVDFGVAKPTELVEEPESDALALPEALPATMTRTGQLMGTPAYMAAEQFLGETVDARTDIFAFCVALYEALEGRRPYAGEDPAALCRSVLSGEFRPLPRSLRPRPLATLIERGLSRAPERRPGSLEPFIEVLTGAGGPNRRRRWLFGAGALVATCALGSTVFMKRQAEAPGVEARAQAARELADAEARQRDDFASLLAVPDDEARAAAAEDFLEQYGDESHPARRAVAHSIIGDIAWRASCETPQLGLCVEPQATPDLGDLCTVPIRGAYNLIERDQPLVERAREHLEAARALSGIERPEDEDLASTFDTAIARSLTQLADAGVESHLTQSLPANLDFNDAAALSGEAFRLFYGQHVRNGAALLKEYKGVKGLDPAWSLVAGARSAQIYEATGVVFANVPPPAGLASNERGAYCKMLREGVLDPAFMSAFKAYQWCDAHASEHGLEDHPLGNYCRKRYVLFLADGSEEIAAEVEAKLK